MTYRYCVSHKIGNGRKLIRSRNDITLSTEVREMQFIWLIRVCLLSEPLRLCFWGLDLTEVGYKPITETDYGVRELGAESDERRGSSERRW